MAKGLTYTTPPQMTQPVWCADPIIYWLVPAPAKLLAAGFTAPAAVTATVGVAGAAVGATSIPVSALSGPIPFGTLLDFGSGKFARLTLRAATSATTLTVEALTAALVSGEDAVYPGSTLKTVPAGTPVGRTLNERNAGTAYGPAASTDAEIFFTARTVVDVTDDNDVELVRHHATIKENKLPVPFTQEDSNLVTALRGFYNCIMGAE